MRIEKIIAAFGGATAVGRICNVTRQAVVQWHEVPTRFVLILAGEGILTPHDMRRDLYPHPLDGMRTTPTRRKRSAA
jgi:hypothetical protein